MSEENTTNKLDVYVNGRRALLQALDSMLAEERNIKTFRDTMQDVFDANPLSFFKEIVMPLMPKDMLGLTAEDDAKNTNQHIMIEFLPAPIKGELTLTAVDEEGKGKAT